MNLDTSKHCSQTIKMVNLPFSWYFPVPPSPMCVVGTPYKKVYSIFSHRRCVEQAEPWIYASCLPNIVASMENSTAISQKIENGITICSRNSTSERVSKWIEIKIVKISSHSQKHYTVVYKGQDMEPTSQLTTLKEIQQTHIKEYFGGLMKKKILSCVIVWVESCPLALRPWSHWDKPPRRAHRKRLHIYLLGALLFLSPVLGL